MTTPNTTFSLSKLGEPDLLDIDIFDALRQIRKWGGRADNFSKWTTEPGSCAKSPVTWRSADWFYDDGRVFGGKIVEVKK